MSTVTDEQVVAESYVLKGSELLKLWSQGREAWNAWVQANPTAAVDLSDISFPNDIEKPFADFHLPRRRELKGRLWEVNTTGALFAQTINAKHALALWKKGKEYWNQYSQQPEYQDYDVNFEGIRFPEGDVDFAGFIFPEQGDVSFSAARFGNGHVNFSGALFGSGHVNFSKALFGKGYVDFSRVMFGDGHVDFSEARFGEGHVDFRRTTFGKGHVDFSKTRFGEGHVNFRRAVFGLGQVDFSAVGFSDGDVNFSKTQFGDGDVSFSRARFGEGDVNFDESSFGEGDVDFGWTQFGDGDVDFSYAQFSEGEVNFESAKLSTLNFSKVDTKHCTRLNFKSLSCTDHINFSGMQTSTVVDLTDSSIQQPVNLDDTNIGFQALTWRDVKNTRNIWLPRAKNKQDESAFKQLKQLAQDANDHSHVLEFFAKEKRCSFLNRLPMYSPKLWFYILYDGLSDYGRSVLRPLMLLVVSWLLFAFIYLNAANSADMQNHDCHNQGVLLQCEVVSAVHSMSLGVLLRGYYDTNCSTICPAFDQAKDFSASNIVPLLSSINSTRDNERRSLFVDPIDPDNPSLQFKALIELPKEVHHWARVQNVISVILLLLLGIAIWNRFKVQKK